MLRYLAGYSLTNGTNLRRNLSSLRANCLRPRLTKTETHGWARFISNVSDSVNSFPGPTALLVLIAVSVPLPVWTDDYNRKTLGVGSVPNNTIEAKSRSHLSRYAYGPWSRIEKSVPSFRNPTQASE